MWGIVPPASDALLAPYSEREVSGLVGLPICQARRSWVSRLLAPPCLFPRELSTGTILPISFDYLAVDLSCTLPARGDPSPGGARLRISFSKPGAIKGFNASTSISSSCIRVIAATFCIDDRLLDSHRLQPLFITGQKATRWS